MGCVFPPKKEKNGEYTLFRPYHHYYFLLGEILNLTWDFPFPRNGQYWNPHSFYSEMNYGYYDIAGGGMTGGYYNYDKNGGNVDFSATTFYNPGISIISVEPSEAMRWSALVEPFDTFTWLSLLSSIPVCGTALYFLWKHGNAQNEGGRLGDAIWYFTVILLWESITIKKSKILSYVNFPFSYVHDHPYGEFLPRRVHSYSG